MRAKDAYEAKSMVLNLDPYETTIYVDHLLNPSVAEDYFVEGFQAAKVAMIELLELHI